MFYGPDDCYVYSGYGEFATHPGLNSLTVNVIGSRRVSFKDGMTFHFTNATVSISNRV